MNIILSFPNHCKPCKDLETEFGILTFAVGNAGVIPTAFRLFWGYKGARDALNPPLQYNLPGHSRGGAGG